MTAMLTPTTAYELTAIRPAGPDLTTYRAVHRAVRRAPHRLADAVLALDPSQRGRTEALVRYWRGYAAEVLAHHTVEDRIFFPALVARVPEARSHIERTDDEHHVLDELMAACEISVRDLRRGATRTLRGRAADDLRALASHMDTHLDFEDEVIIPLFADRMSANEYEGLEQQAIKLIGVGMQAAFAVPFVLDAVDPAELPRLLATAPLPLRLLYRVSRGRHARLAAVVFGTELEGRS